MRSAGFSGDAALHRSTSTFCPRQDTTFVLAPPVHQWHEESALKTALEKLQQQVIACELCPRLRRHCEKVAREKRRAYREWEYWGKPIASFGDPQARLLIVGLAPAA